MMAKQLGIPLHRIFVLKMRPYLAPIRYPIQALLTLRLLFQARPGLVFVQNPPIFAPLCVWLYCALTGSRFIIDSHTDALHGPLWQWSWPLHAFLSRRAVTTLVTNSYLQRKVENWGAHSHIITDVPSEFPLGKPYPLAQPFNLAFVSSFSTDEPLDAIIEVARSLPQVGIYVTGDPARSQRPLPPDLPENLHITGFLPEDAYYGLLRSVQAVMVLTTEDHTMQRGACEAVWLGQPIITSDWPILREAFHLGAIHVDNSVAGIRAGILKMQESYRALAMQLPRLQDERRQQWAAALVALQQAISLDAEA
jgi:glycosyltransferase involved in cell wall biosynthesis